jgi:Leucine-rich repeat (LRR) protein
VVDLRNNLIKELPESLCSLAVLWKIRIDYNLLEALPDNIGRLEKLEVLTASNNKIKSIPASLY